MFDKLFTSKPINKTASIQVGQSGCNDRLTLDQMYQNAISAKMAITDDKNKLKKGFEDCGVRLDQINSELSRLKSAIRERNKRLDNDKQRESIKRKMERVREVERKERQRSHKVFKELRKILKDRLGENGYRDLMQEAVMRSKVDCEDSK